MAESNRSCIIVGGGISGLCAAYWLVRENIDVTVLERDDIPGGAMKTVRVNGYLIDTGPNSSLETTPLFSELFDALGITDDRVYANEQSNKRYILRDGKIHPLPMSAGSFLKTKLWSTKGKLRLLKEPFVGRAHTEESIAQFVERRLGREFLDYAINPFVAGVYAGNPEELSVRSAFPKLYRLEDIYGGLIKGMIRGRKERKQRAEKSKQSARMFSFIDGMGTFPHVLAGALGDRLLLGTKVTSIERKNNAFRVTADTSEGRKVFTAANVILSVPAYHAAGMLKSIDSEIAGTLSGINYPPVTMVFLGYRTDAITYPLDGFGFLIPAKEKRKILGTIWSSTIFPNRAPNGYSAFTTFVGGSRQPEMTEYTDAELLEIVHDEIASILGIREKPSFHYIMQWKRAIPQYKLGYAKTIEQIEQFERSNPGLHLCANYRGGIAVGDCVMSARRTVVALVHSENK
jgi:protoporphyrinogen/coproporphyrinogen III oxidase